MFKKLKNLFRRNGKSTVKDAANLGITSETVEEIHAAQRRVAERRRIASLSSQRRNDRTGDDGFMFNQQQMNNIYSSAQASDSRSSCPSNHSSSHSSEHSHSSHDSGSSHSHDSGSPSSSYDSGSSCSSSSSD
jgi:hypothetical protein